MFTGSFPALVTPFKENFDIDFDAYGRLIDRQLEAGTHGIVPCGCTGEAATLTHDEQKQLLKFAVERVAGRVPVIGGTGSNNTREAIDLTRFAKEAGCDGALIITPYYNKPTAPGQIAHYTAIAEAVDIPIMLYNVPGRTACKLEPEVIAELSKVPNIVSVKEACGSVDQVTQIISLCDINVMSGDDSLTLPMIAVGATGVVSVAANVVPAEMAQLCNAANAGGLRQGPRDPFPPGAAVQGAVHRNQPPAREGGPRPDGAHPECAAPAAHPHERRRPGQADAGVEAGGPPVALRKRTYDRFKRAGCVFYANLPVAYSCAHTQKDAKFAYTFLQFPNAPAVNYRYHPSTWTPVQIPLENLYSYETQRFHPH
jgi:4-hydroxy-tetrahydrodipicolinate synthase